MIGVTTCNDYFIDFCSGKVSGGARWKPAPPPKVPRCGSFAASDTNGPICQSLVQLQLGGVHVRPGAVAKKRTGSGNLHILQIGRSAQNRQKAPFRSDMAATLARLGVIFGQQSPNFSPTWTNWLQLRPNLAPRWRNLAPNLDPFWSNFGPSWGPYGFKMGTYIAGPIRNPQKVPFHWYIITGIFPRFWCLRWAQLGVNWLYWPAVLWCLCVRRGSKARLLPRRAVKR